MIRASILLGFILFINISFGQNTVSRIEKDLPKIDISISSLSEFNSGEPIIIQCEISNNSESIQRFDFTEYHKYHKDLPYATCITSIVKDSNDSSLCKFGTQYVVWSTLFTENDLKYIKIKPGEKIVRKLNICDIAYDCTCDYKNGFKEGKYKIQLFVHLRPSNILEIKVK